MFWSAKKIITLGSIVGSMVLCKALILLRSKFKSGTQSPKLLLQINISKASELKHKFTADELYNFKQVYYAIFRDANLTADNRQFFVVTLWIIMYVYDIGNFVITDINSVIQAIFSEDSGYLDQHLGFHSILYSFVTQLTDKPSLSKILDAIKLYEPTSTGEDYDEDKLKADTLIRDLQEYIDALLSMARPLTHTNFVKVSVIYLYLYMQQNWLTH